VEHLQQIVEAEVDPRGRLEVDEQRKARNELLQVKN
jgi:hypothetical protein